MIILRSYEEEEIEAVNLASPDESTSHQLSTFRTWMNNYTHNISRCGMYWKVNKKVIVYM